MINTHLIGKHLPILQDGFPIQSCAICGATNIHGFRRAEVISSSFTDHDFLSTDKQICQYCAACLGKGQPRNHFLRNTSFLATKSQLLRLKREEIWQYIFNPPSPPFIFGVTYNHKKHISFKAPINLSRENYQIRTENECVTIPPKAIQPLSAILQKWYTICRDIKTEPTYFTKNDILMGCNNYKKIETYGIYTYLAENQKIQPYRQTALLQLLTYALNKGGIND